MTEKITKPYPPADDDCCGGGACCPCVWDYYYEQLALWQAQQTKTADDEVTKISTVIADDS